VIPTRTNAPPQGRGDARRHSVLATTSVCGSLTAGQRGASATSASRLGGGRAVQDPVAAGADEPVPLPVAAQPKLEPAASEAVAPGAHRTLAGEPVERGPSLGEVGGRGLPGRAERVQPAATGLLPGDRPPQQLPRGHAGRRGQLGQATSRSQQPCGAAGQVGLQVERQATVAGSGRQLEGAGCGVGGQRQPGPPAVGRRRVAGPPAAPPAGPVAAAAGAARQRRRRAPVGLARVDPRVGGRLGPVRRPATRRSGGGRAGRPAPRRAAAHATAAVRTGRRPARRPPGSRPPRRACTGRPSPGRSSVAAARRAGQQVGARAPHVVGHLGQQLPVEQGRGVPDLGGDSRPGPGPTRGVQHPDPHPDLVGPSAAALHRGTHLPGRDRQLPDRAAAGVAAAAGQPVGVQPRPLLQRGHPGLPPPGQAEAATRRRGPEADRRSSCGRFLMASPGG
jgi:hypothetical protein